MNRIKRLFANRGEKIIPFLTAGFPTLKATTQLVLTAQKAGADMIELGIPFSDPLADGPVIQASSQIALQNGVTLPWILDQVRIIRKSSEIPIVFMGYLNPIMHYGTHVFLKDCREVGVDGIIVPDLPPEEGEEFISQSKSEGVSPILLVAPNTPADRIEKISLLGGDLIYCVSILGITGSKLSRKEILKTYLLRVREHSRTPFIVGFGVKTRQDVRNISSMADGVVVGSAIIQEIMDSNNPKESVFKYIRELKNQKGAT